MLHYFMEIEQDYSNDDEQHPSDYIWRFQILILWCNGHPSITFATFMHLFSN